MTGSCAGVSRWGPRCGPNARRSGLEGFPAEHDGDRRGPSRARRGRGRTRRLDRPALPLADIESADVDLVGRFVDLVESLERCVDARPSPHRGAVARSTGPGRPPTSPRAIARRHGRPRARSRRSTPPSTTASRSVLRRADVHRPARRDGRRATHPRQLPHRELTVCSMVPMRSVPHRAVVLLGLDDDTYPRANRADATTSWGEIPSWANGIRVPRPSAPVGHDPCPRPTDSPSASSGTDPVSRSASRPPSVPVSELLDTLVTLVGADVPDRSSTDIRCTPSNPASFVADHPADHPSTTWPTRRRVRSRSTRSPSPVPARCRTVVGHARVRTGRRYRSRPTRWATTSTSVTSSRSWSTDARVPPAAAAHRRFPRPTTHCPTR